MLLVVPPSFRHVPVVCLAVLCHAVNVFLYSRSCSYSSFLLLPRLLFLVLSWVVSRGERCTTIVAVAER